MSSIWGCRECHHEWQGSDDDERNCEWCGADSPNKLGPAYVPKHMKVKGNGANMAAYFLRMLGLIT